MFVKGYQDRTRNYLIYIFLIGGVIGFVESGKFDISYSIGSGIGTLALAITVGSIIHFITRNIEKSKVSKSNILDEDLVKQKPSEARDQATPFKYSVYVALVFLFMLLWDRFL